MGGGVAHNTATKRSLTTTPQPSMTPQRLRNGTTSGQSIMRCIVLAHELLLGFLSDVRKEIPQSVTTPNETLIDPVPRNTEAISNLDS